VEGPRFPERAKVGSAADRTLPQTLSTVEAPRYPEEPAKEAAAPGRIFISYRREQASGVAGRLYERLADQFGETQVFMDVASIEAGVDFTEVITRAVASCEVLLAVIGPGWLTAPDEAGQRGSGAWTTRTTWCAWRWRLRWRGTCP